MATVGGLFGCSGCSDRTEIVYIWSLIQALWIMIRRSHRLKGFAVVWFEVYGRKLRQDNQCQGGWTLETMRVDKQLGSLYS